MSAPGRGKVKRMADSLPVRVALGAVLPASMLAIWALASGKPSGILPTPLEVADVLAHPFREPPNLDCRSLFHSAGISILRVAIGFSAAALTAVPLGLLAGWWKWAHRIVSPLLELFRPVCPIALMPLAILLFGLSSFGSLLWGDRAWEHDLLSHLQIAMVFIIWWGAFFPIFLNTAAGASGVRSLHMEAARMLGAGPWFIFSRVVLPSSLPSIFTGLRIGMGLAWMVIIAAEIFPGTRSGLGYMILTAHQVDQYEYAFAAILVIGAVGLGANSLMLKATSRAGRWEARER